MFRVSMLSRMRNILGNIAYLDNNKIGFSLMEMMVVLLIVAILAAATAPMVTKKMARNAGNAESPWVYTGLSNSIAYNMNGSNSTAIIGATQYNNGGKGPDHPRLVLAGDTSHPGLVFADKDGVFTFQMKFDDTSVALNDAAIGSHSVAVGMGQAVTNEIKQTTSVGYGAKATKESATAVGYSSVADATSAIAIGNQAEAGTGAAAIAIGEAVKATGFSSIAIGAANESGRGEASGSTSIAIGRNVSATNENAVAIGLSARATGINSCAIGSLAEATHNGSVAIGLNARTRSNGQIVLGDENTTVYIPGNLAIGRITYTGVDLSRDFVTREAQSSLWVTSSEVSSGKYFQRKLMKTEKDNVAQLNKNTPWTRSNVPNLSDRRLKNVGEAYTAGLGELKKLDFYHYTFKKDEAKTPHVGVMAQDLQKVFPDAVTEGDDGYLRIRMEDMFYAVINAVKELDAKITQIIENVTSLSKKVDEQQQIIETQQKLIEELQAQNADIEKRLAKVEKKNKKLAE